MTTPKETCPKCGAEVSVIAVESALIDFNCGTTKWSDAIAERHQLPKLNQSDRCRITELEKENERLRKIASSITTAEQFQRINLCKFNGKWQVRTVTYERDETATDWFDNLSDAIQAYASTLLAKGKTE
jgi:hypothetical protein